MQKKTIKTGIKKHYKVNTTTINKIYKKRWYKENENKKSNNKYRKISNKRRS